MKDVFAKGARSAPLAAISALAGLLLLAYSVARAGVPEIVDGLHNIGTGFLLVLLLSGIRFTARTIAWIICIEGTPRVPLAEALSAKMIGDTLGSLTPLGLFVSEPAKAVLVGRHVRLGNALAAMLVENIVYSASAVAVIAVGIGVVLTTLPLPEPLRRLSIGALVGALAVAGAFVLVTARPTLLSGLLGRLGQRLPPALHRSLDRMQRAEEQIFGFARRRPARIVPVVALALLFQAAAIAEVYVILDFVSPFTTPTFLTAFVLEAVNRIVTIAFTFVPLGLGVDEAASGFMSNALRLGTAAGVTLALVRKARILCWSAVGIALLARRGFSARGER
jgi:hypothetical protein